LELILIICAIIVTLSVVTTAVYVAVLLRRGKLGDRVARATEPPPVELKRECRNCKHFDLEEGQHAINSHPAFVQAGRYLAPAQMGLNVTYKDCACVEGMGADARDTYLRKAIEGEPETRCKTCGGSGAIRIEPEGDMPLRARWDQFGACINPELPEGDLRWNQDVCDHFELKEQA
jgi:hypothetical protein